MTSVAVVMTTIPGREDMRARAMNSVYDQTHQCELVVYVDMEGVGAAAARNKAISGVPKVIEWIAFLDDDDVLYPNHVESLLACAQANGADLVYPWFDGPNDYGRTLGVPDEDGNRVSPLSVPFDDRLEAFLRTDNFIPVTVLVRASLVHQVGGFPVEGDDDRMPDQHGPAACDEWGFWLRLLDAGARFVHWPERTWHYSVHGRNTSGRPWRTIGWGPRQ